MRLATLVLLVLLAVGCTSTVKRPDVFLLPENQITWEEGEVLVRQGTDQIAAAERKIEEGRALRDRADELIRQGREERKHGEALAQRGREALRAARMLEEAEKLRREGREKRSEALEL